MLDVGAKILEADLDWPGAPMKIKKNSQNKKIAKVT